MASCTNKPSESELGFLCTSKYPTAELLLFCFQRLFLQQRWRVALYPEVNRWKRFGFWGETWTYLHLQHIWNCCSNTCQCIHETYQSWRNAFKQMPSPRVMINTVRIQLGIFCIMTQVNWTPSKSLSGFFLVFFLSMQCQIINFCGRRVVKTRVRRYPWSLVRLICSHPL